jgi:2-oxoglutarate dehydrogenase E2 component (dihydrolipoamide succinyltransferase)
MPQLGETVTEGTIIKWLKKVGDPVAHDEPLFEVSTDKVDSEVPSSLEGVLTEILVEEGATVDIGTRLAVIGDAGDGSASVPAAPAETPAQPAPTPAEAGPTAAAPPETAAAPPAETDAAETEAAAARAPASAEPTAVPEAAETAETPAQPEPVPAAAEETAAAGAGGASALLSPVVRKLVNEHGLDPASIKGTGQGGRITRGDVLGHLDAQAVAGGGSQATGAAASVAPATPPAPAAAGTPAAQAGPGESRGFPPAVAGGRDEVVPFSNIRRLTAEHMVRSKATSAHTLVVVEADYEGVERVRRREKDRFREQEGVSLSYLPFIARAVVDVLRDYPHLNASVGDGALLVHKDVHLGIAVDLDRQGLIVPVVRQADGQSLRGLARAIGDLAERARSRRLSADDVVGGTFTITNPGPFGTLITAPIINQPQVAILSTDGVKRRPVVVTAEDGTEAIAIHSVGMLAMSFDHRAVDGAYASAFLRDLARAIETRDWAAEL